MDDERKSYENLRKKYNFEESRSIMGIPEKIKEILFSPSEFFDKVRKEKGILEPLKYYAVLAIFANVIAVLVSFFMKALPFSNPVQLLSRIALNYLFTMAVFVSLSIINHIFAKILNGRGDFASTFGALSYALTPSLILGWILSIISIPFSWLLVSTWTVYLAIIGLSKLHQVSVFRSFFIFFGLEIVLIVLMGVSIVFLSSVYNHEVSGLLQVEIALRNITMPSVP